MQDLGKSPMCLEEKVIFQLLRCGVLGIYIPRWMVRRSRDLPSLCSVIPTTALWAIDSETAFRFFGPHFGSWVGAAKVFRILGMGPSLVMGKQLASLRIVLKLCFQRKGLLIQARIDTVLSENTRAPSNPVLVHSHLQSHPLMLAPSGKFLTKQCSA